MAEYQFDNDMYMDNINIQMQNTSVSSDSDKANHSKNGYQKQIDPTLIRQQPEINRMSGVGLNGQEEFKDGSQQQQIQINSGEKSWIQKCCPCLTIEFFQSYFDITTNELTMRLLTSLIPFNRKFYQSYKSKPDLYGPFWIYTTLIMILSISGNYSMYLQSSASETNFVYNFNYIPIAATIIYCTGLGMPFALKLIMRFMGANFFSGTFIEIAGIYAYSFTSFLITAFVCAFPISGLQWTFVIYSAITSTGFLIATFWSDLSETLDAKKRLIVIAFICGVQVMFLMIFKFYFFQHVGGQ
eukprot:403341685